MFVSILEPEFLINENDLDFPVEIHEIRYHQFSLV